MQHPTHASVVNLTHSFYKLTWAQSAQGELLWPAFVRRRASSVNCFTSPLIPLIGFWPNFTGIIPGWSPTKGVQIVSVGCISRSRGQKKGFQNAIFKNRLVWNYNAQSFHIWYKASSRGPLPKLFKLCPLGQNWPRPGGHNFTLIYNIMKYDIR